MSHFSYEHITDSFVKTLAEEVLATESTVLIGPRYGGKRHVLFLLRRLLQKHGLTPIVDIRFLDQSPLLTEQEVHARISEAVAAVAPDLIRPGADQIGDPISEHITDPIKALAMKTGAPVVMLASNVDGMAHHLARKFLEGVRTLVDARQLIAVMSGENDFHELVYGPKSEFNVASQYFVQGYGEKEFAQSLSHYIDHFRFTVDEPERFSHHLWQITGGNLYIARIILSILTETRANSGSSPEKPIGLDDVPTSFRGSVLTIYGDHMFRHARQLVDREPESWNDLKTLLAGDTFELAASANAPTLLELAGIAVRVPHEQSIRVQCASPIMEEYIKDFYDDRRFGDLYAGNNDWPEAFRQYRKLNAEETIRPLSSDDRNEVEATVNALCAALYSEVTRPMESGAPKPLDRIKELFAQGCHYLLGFREITFWHRDTGHSPKWNSIPMDILGLADRELEKIEELLPSDNTLTPGLLPVPMPWNRFAVAAILPTLGPDQQAAVVVSDLEKTPAISQEREVLVKRLLDHFEKAYSHALRVHDVQVRSRVRGKQISIINDVLNSIRGPVGAGVQLSVQHLLEMAARGLRELQYRRVLFCLVDHEKGLLEGIVDDCEAPLKSVARLISYPLSAPTESLQANVIARRDAVIVKDARRHPMADQRVVAAGNMKAFAIIPILTPSNEAIGTLLVERRNAVPDEAEVEDLKTFCQQLTLAIENCERVTLLQTGLDLIPEPVFIVDSFERPRYANRPAADLLKVPIGWQNESKNVSALTRSNAGKVIDVIHEAMSSGHRRAGHIEGIGENQDYRGAVVASTINETWDQEGAQREKTLGGLVRIQDLTYLYKVFEASRHIAEADDTPSALRNMLEAAMQLGHERSKSIWGRLYLVRATGDTDLEFVSTVSAGYQDELLTRNFMQGKVILARRSSVGHYDWLCIEKQAPVVFCWKEELETGDPFITRNGLMAVNWRCPNQPEQIAKKPGDFWIDFPLMTKDGKALGKICLQCDEDLQPENFVYLKVLCETFSRLLQTFNNFDKTRDTIRKEVAQKTLATLAHNIGTRLGGLPGILEDYRDIEANIALWKQLNEGSPETLQEFRDIEKSAPRFQEVNDAFDHTLERTFRTIKDANQRLQPVTPKTVTLDLAEHVERSLRASLPADAWSVDCKERPFKVPVDIQLFETALLELVQNSRDAAPDQKVMKIDIELSTVPGASSPTASVIYRDNGPGIPPELTERIFEDFYSRRPGETLGTGLGLGFVRRVVEAHYGRVFCNTINQVGAQFNITLPMSQ